MVVTILFVPAKASSTKLPNKILLELAKVLILKPFVMLPPASVEIPFPNFRVCVLATFTCATLFVYVIVFDATLLACGSTIVSVPPVKFIFCEFNCTIETLEATELAAIPASFPSTLISPPL